LKRKSIVQGNETFGKAFEHFIYNEIYAHSHYSDLHYPVSYWRTASKIEIDFILGDHEVAVEVKATNNVNPHHLRGLNAFAEEYKVRKQIVVSTDPYPRKIGKALILPWREFLNQLWSGELMS
jgi:predicted AAA+ superfamily ATPase